MKTVGLLTVAMGAFLVFVSIFVSKSPCSEPGQGDFIETVSPYGYINWTQGTVFAKEIKAPRNTVSATDPLEGGEETDASTRQEEENRHGSLLRVVRRVRIDTATYVEDLVEGDDMMQRQLQGMIKQAKTVKREYVSDGTVKTTVAFDILGAFAQLALPQEIKPVPEIKTIFQGRAEDDGNPSSDGRSRHSGVVFDAGGLSGVPTMAPRITNENGQEIYGPGFVSREFAVQYGMAAFERNVDAAKTHPRVEGNPLVVTCLKTSGEMSCDFIISNVDASRILGASENLKLLKKCKVVIVLD